MLAKPAGDTATRAHIGADVVGPQAQPCQHACLQPLTFC